MSLDVVKRGAGPALLLIHGTGATSDFWGEAADRLAYRCCVVSYDRRGTGQSSNCPTAHHDVHADDAAAIIRELNVGPVTVLGWSMGGIVALCVAHRHPELVRGLVLQEPPLYARQDRGFAVLKGIVPVVAFARLGMKVRAAERFNRWTYGSGGTGYDHFPEPWTICAEIDLGTGEQVLTLTPLSGRVRAPRPESVGDCGHSREVRHARPLPSPVSRENRR